MADPLATGTPAQIEAAAIAALRALSPARRLMLARDMGWMADWVALAGIQRRRPGASPRELGYDLALQRLAPERRPHGAALLRGAPLMPVPADPLALALRAGALLDARAIPYFIVGSMAVGAHGEHRLTRDIDIVLDLALKDVVALGDGLRADFTFLPGELTDALLRPPAAQAEWGRPADFCAYDKTTGFRIDMYLALGSPFDISRIRRAQVLDIRGEPRGILRVASAEDTLLATLGWYRLAPSDRQWRDAQAILRVQGDLLDISYIRHWAAELLLLDLLKWALSGQPPPAA